MPSQNPVSPTGAKRRGAAQLADLLWFIALVIPMLGLVAMIAAAAARAVVAPPDVAALKGQILERWHAFVVAPEPVERFAYIATILSIVPVSLLCIALVRRMPTDWARGISGSWVAIGWSLVSLALFVLALQQPFMRSIILGPAPASTTRNLQFLVILGVAAVAAGVAAVVAAARVDRVVQQLGLLDVQLLDLGQAAFLT